MLGFLVAALYISKSSISLRTLQLGGFIAMTIIYFILSIFYNTIRTLPTIFVGLYAMTFLCANAGPNSTTFILPTLVFKSNTATCHGLSAAAGKVGAMVGAAGMAPLLVKFGPHAIFFLCGIVGILGAIITVCFIPADLGVTDKDEPYDLDVITTPASPESEIDNESSSTEFPRSPVLDCGPLVGALNRVSNRVDQQPQE